MPEDAPFECAPAASGQTDAAACAAQAFRAGRAHDQAGDFAEAFRAFDAAFRASDEASHAAMYALDALHRRMQELEQPNDCPQRIEVELARYRTELCRTPALRRQEDCLQLDRLSCRTQFVSALDLAETDPAAASVRFEALADDARCADEHADHLYNAALTAEHAGDSGRAAALRERLTREHPMNPNAM